MATSPNATSPAPVNSYRNRSDVHGKFQVPNFVPEIWTGKIMANMQGNRILSNFVNRDYEGEIRNGGDRVWVYGSGRLSVEDYIVNETQIAYELAKSFKMDFTIDQAKYWAFRVEDIEKAQSKPDYVSKLTAEAGFALAKETEKFLFDKHLEGARMTTPNALGYKGGNAGVAVDWSNLTDPTKVYNNLVELGVLMDDEMVPDSGRYIIIPSFVEALVRLDDRFIAYGQDSGNSMKVGGSIGTLADFELVKLPRPYFKSAALSTRELEALLSSAPTIVVNGKALEDWTETDWAEHMVKLREVGVGAYDGDTGTYSTVAGVRNAVSYAEQFTKTEALRLEGSFSDAARGLLLYGAQAMTPNHLFGVDIVDPSDEGTGTGQVPETP